MGGKKRCVIVGAGPSGLVALKEMLEAGHEATLIERSNVIGGVFSTLAESAYDGLYLTISNVFMAYSDYPCKEEFLKYSKKEEYAVYLNEYADAFGLRSNMEMETNVDKAKLGKDGLWRIEVTSKTQGKKTIEADSLLVCTGSNQTPKETPENVKKFGGKIMHSSDFQNAEGFEGKNVLIIGTGESSSDMACEIAGVAKETTVWARRPFILAPRFWANQHLRPDYDEFVWLKDESKWKACTVGDYLETGTTSRAMNSLPMWIYGASRQLGWHLIDKVFKGVSPGAAFLGRYSRAATAYEGVPNSIYFRADQAAWVTKNARISDMAGRQELQVVIAPEAEFTSTSVTFKKLVVDPVTAEAVDEPYDLSKNIDVVVCCTGYTNNFDWLETDPSFGAVGWCPRMWYKHCWPPGFGDKLAFIGWARPHQGGIPQTSELCSRFHALLLSGERFLPENIAELTAVEAKAENEFYVLSPKLTSLVDWPSFSVALARMIGCEPSTPWFIFTPITWLKYWLFPLWPCWYRLRGPGAKPDTFKTVMNRFAFFGSGVLQEPVNFMFAIPFAPIQKFGVNVFSFLCRPFSGGLTGYAGPSSLLDRSKINILHGCNVSFKSLISFAV